MVKDCQEMNKTLEVEAQTFQTDITKKLKVLEGENEKHLKNPFKLVVCPRVVFKKYIKGLRYGWNINWVLIGSMGDPKTWKGN